ncbi:Ketosteroid isomerase homolog [Mucilaginibacter sp. OK268]|uniref:YybH family protein n=1 Tax=Mucilaginibacter sp. OK268 TaxID=1881048 RepID=UPI000883CEB1|nr:nuclear transport factor 2 family protein [Mucilaginibacter sp. OK268]SDP99200.1 Ketosteroid isomerase homolog [Mucilaginibacter sp. OK268]
MNQLLSAVPIWAIFMMCFNIQSPELETQSNLSEAKKAIAASNQIYFQAFVKNDPIIFIDRYADDCVIMPPNMEPLHGMAGARQFFKMAYDQFGLRDGRFITTAIYGDGGTFVTEEGIWQSFDAKHRLFDNGKFLVLWKKTAKGWKMFRDSFSSNRRRK